MSTAWAASLYEVHPACRAPEGAAASSYVSYFVLDMISNNRNVSNDDNESAEWSQRRICMVIAPCEHVYSIARPAGRYSGQDIVLINSERRTGNA